jgi:hypothetical protein
MKKILLSVLAVSSFAVAGAACNNAGSGGSASADPNAKPAAAAPSAAAATPSAKPANSAKPSGGGW